MENELLRKYKMEYMNKKQGFQLLPDQLGSVKA